VVSSVALEGRAHDDVSGQASRDVAVVPCGLVDREPDAESAELAAAIAGATRVPAGVHQLLLLAGLRGPHAAHAASADGAAAHAAALGHALAARGLRDFLPAGRGADVPQETSGYEVCVECLCHGSEMKLWCV